MGSGMKVFIAIMACLILIKHPELLSQFINGITQLVNG
jgi:hypothetical protein